jgi:two-component system, sensor histidine kinase ChiS
MRYKLMAGGICIIVTLLIVFTIMQFEKANIDSNDPVAKQGLFDLSQYDLTAEGALPLNGDWEFYEGQLLSMSEINSGNYESLKLIVPVPITWNAYSLNREEPLSFGTGTFRLHVQLSSSSDQIVGIKTSNIGYSNKIFHILQFSCKQRTALT